MFKPNSKKRKSNSTSDLNPPRKKRKFNAPKFGNLPIKPSTQSNHKSSTQSNDKSSSISLSTSTQKLTIKPKNKNSKRKFVALKPKMNAIKKTSKNNTNSSKTKKSPKSSSSKNKKSSSHPSNKMTVRKGKKKFKFIAPKIADEAIARKHFGEAVENFKSAYGAVFGCLGARKYKTTLPKHDPDDENAIVLWRPEELQSESDSDSDSGSDSGSDNDNNNNGCDEDNKYRIAAKKNALAIKAASNKKKKGKKIKVPIVVDPRLGNKLRSHQVVGVEFVYRCMMDKKYAHNNKWGQGCILADGMGLGKTLQAITVMWTLLEQDIFAGEQTCKNGIVISPATLVENWQNEIFQWLGEKGKTIKPYPCLSKTKEVIKNWLSAIKSSSCGNIKPVLIISYESYRSYHEKICWKNGKKPPLSKMNDNNLKNDIGFVVCDEGHKLKNHKSQLSISVSHISSRKRLLLSGTPIQNNLKEMYSLVNFVNPGVWDSVKDFSKSACQIVRSFDSSHKNNKNAKKIAKVSEQGDKALSAVRSILNTFLLQRTSKVVMKYLPQKNEYIIFCKLTKIQQIIYKKFLSSKAAKQAKDAASAGGGLSAIGFLAVAVLNKLCNHPALIYEASAQIAKIKINKSKWKLVSAANKSKSRKKKKKKNIVHNTSDKYDRNGNRIRTELAGLYELYPNNFIDNYFKAIHSSKMSFTISLLLQLKQQNTGDKTVIVSVYTETLDILAMTLEKNGIYFLRLDGSIPTKKRQPIVNDFNDAHSKYLVLLLSNRAGGCGLNLIGANRLIMYDADWNPANDAQAMARVWRSGQLKKTYIYRLFSTGTLEEKIFQRQTFKSDLAEQLVAAEEDITDMTEFAVKELRDIFKYNEHTICDTYERTKGGGYVGWKKVKYCDNVGDPFLTRAAKPGNVSFLFHRIVNDPKMQLDMENGDIVMKNCNSNNNNNNKENINNYNKRRRSSSINSVRSNGSVKSNKSESDSPLVSKKKNKKKFGLKNNNKKVILNGKNKKGNGEILNLCDSTSDDDDYENYSQSDGEFKPNKNNNNNNDSSDSDSDSDSSDSSDSESDGY